VILTNGRWHRLHRGIKKIAKRVANDYDKPTSEFFSTLAKGSYYKNIVKSIIFP